MGNQVCCQETRTHGVLQKEAQIIRHPVVVEPPKNKEKSQIKVESEIKQHPKENIQIPKLPLKVSQTLTKKHFFKQEETKTNNSHVKKYGKDIYEGQLDEFELKPNGFGRMYKQNGSLYIGNFNHGKAQGKGAFIFADGSYFYGDFNNNCAETQKGEFHSQTMQYSGGFKNNNFEGHGLENGKTYVFEGQFHNGSRTKGTLKWENDTHIYTGSFNSQNRFSGKGNLKQPQGTYQGDFLDGEKHGKGIYHSAKGSRYEGDYIKGYREGQGIIYHGNGQIAYTGSLKKGLPHGKGSISKEGKLIEANWVEGIDSNLLPE